LRQALQAKYGDKIVIEGERTPSATGLFEVQIVNGPLAFSKKQTNRFPESKEDLQKIYELIDKALSDA
jgi:selT/selW/selH-like putative selenoprotein